MRGAFEADDASVILSSFLVTSASDIGGDIGSKSTVVGDACLPASSSPSLAALVDRLLDPFGLLWHIGDYFTKSGSWSCALVIGSCGATV